MQARHNTLLSERRAVSALPGQGRTGGFAQSGLVDSRARLSSAPSKRSLPLSSNSAVLNDWLSRTSSAVSVQSMRTSSRCYSTSSSGETRDHRRHCHSSCFSSHSRPTRARCMCAWICVIVQLTVCTLMFGCSMLRQKTCPVRSEQPSYQEVIKKRKAFSE